MPKRYRYRLHRLKNAYRKAFRREPAIARPVTEEAAQRTIWLMEEELRRAGIPLLGNDHHGAA